MTVSTMTRRDRARKSKDIHGIRAAITETLRTQGHEPIGKWICCVGHLTHGGDFDHRYTIYRLLLASGDRCFLLWNGPTDYRWRTTAP